MKSYFVDTSIVISYLQGKADVVKLLNDIEGELTSSYICLAELYEGVNRVKNKLEIEKSVIDFFRSLSKLYTIDEKVAKQFGEIRAKLKIRGEVIEDIDIFIAATCLVYDLTLITHNIKHFSRINSLKILS